ncbi:hypothetical protein [Streptomyces microflavus]|uniref:hypothetical protein n=1 Tax=Streptomyces microflavus TaxID=1919 RepID=UPI0033F8A3AF
MHCRAHAMEDAGPSQDFFMPAGHSPWGHSFVSVQKAAARSGRSVLTSHPRRAKCRARAAYGAR